MATERVFSNLAVPPGEFLVEELEARGIDLASFAADLAMDIEAMNRLVVGDERITADMALDLEQRLQLSADFWLGLQAEYELTLARGRRGVMRSA